jgi:hypothetical protein
LPLLAVGGLLVLACVLAYAYGALRLGDRVQVLAVARPVAAGQVIAAADVRAVTAARDPSVALIAVADSGRVVGRTAVVPLVAGVLLTPALVGDAAAFPPAGTVTASLALKPGRYPQGVTAGSRVLVVLAAASDPATGQPSATASASADPAETGSGSAPAAVTRMEATVLSVDLTGDGQGATVITLLLGTADGVKVAAASAAGTQDGVVLLQASPGGS